MLYTGRSQSLKASYIFPKKTAIAYSFHQGLIDSISPCFHTLKTYVKDKIEFFVVPKLSIIGAIDSTFN